MIKYKISLKKNLLLFHLLLLKGMSIYKFKMNKKKILKCLLLKGRIQVDITRIVTIIRKDLQYSHLQDQKAFLNKMRS